MNIDPNVLVGRQCFYELCSTEEGRDRCRRVLSETSFNGRLWMSWIEGNTIPTQTLSFVFEFLDKLFINASQYLERKFFTVRRCGTPETCRKIESFIEKF